MNPEVASNVKAELGEGPSWDADKEILYWVDIKGGLVYAHKLGNPSDKIVGRGKSISSAVPRSNGGLALTLEHGFFSLDTTSGKMEPISEPIEANVDGSRFNDGKCDPAGRYWAGTMDEKEGSPLGSLYYLAKGKGVKKVLSQITVSNGLGWSPDSKTMYYIDSPTRRVSSFDYSLQTGDISNRRIAVNFDETKQPGVPDGMAVDAEGMIWVAHWGGARMTRWNPSTGKLLETITLPADQVTSCCFGGKNLDELYITTARADLSEKVLATQPLAGSLFVTKVGVKGLPTYKYEG